MTTTTVEARQQAQSASRSRRGLGFLLLVAALVVVILASLAIGARAIPIGEVWQILLQGGDSQNAKVVLELRIPRTLIGLAAGASLGVAGALVQAVTRNPLADPGILGVNSGAAFVLAIGGGFFGIRGGLGVLALAYLGAFLASIVVWVIGSAGRGGSSPARLILTGVAMGAVLSGITSAIVLTDRERFAIMTSWQSGSLTDRDASLLNYAIWFILLGLIIALAMGTSLNAVALGDDLARSLGANVARTRLLSVFAIMLLAGSATALAGPISFVGLMVPHVVRWFVGPDQRWIICYSVLAAPVLLLTADIIGRILLPTGELPAGIVTAFVGAPFLIFLVRRTKASEL